jgi:glucose/arabinose dehydrogenase
MVVHRGFSMTFMTLPPLPRRFAAWFVIPMLLAALFSARAQEQSIGVPVPPLGAGLFVLDMAEQHKIRVTVVTQGLSRPWSLVFLPDSSMLVTARAGRLCSRPSEHCR